MKFIIITTASLTKMTAESMPPPNQVHSNPNSRPSTGSSASGKAVINETIRVVCRIRPTLESDSDLQTSPRYSSSGSASASTFITPQSMAQTEAYESHVSSFSPSGELTYSKNFGDEVRKSQEMRQQTHHIHIQIDRQR